MVENKTEKKAPKKVANKKPTAEAPAAAEAGRRTLTVTKSGRPFSKFVEIGRVVYIAHGKLKGKLATIVDIIDQNRALIDGPATGVMRQGYLLKCLHLTRFRLKFPHSCNSKVIRLAWEKNDITSQWSKTKWAQRLEKRKTRANLSDFERFKLQKLKQIRNQVVEREFFRLRKAYRKSVHSRIEANVGKMQKEQESVRTKRKPGQKVKPPPTRLEKRKVKLAAARKAVVAKRAKAAPAKKK